MKQICVITFLLFTSIQLPAQNPYIQHFTTQDGLPSNTVYPIIQDSKRFIWFGTDAGLARYDGSEFTNFSKKDGLNSNEIIVIKEDMQGRIWLINLNGSVNYFNKNKIYNNSNAPFLADLESNHFYRDFFQDSDSTIYFYTFMSHEIVTLNAYNEVKRFTLPEIKHVWNGVESVHLSIQNITKSQKDGIVLWTSAGVIAFHDFSDEPRHLCDTLYFGSCHELCENKFLFQGGEMPGKSRKIFFYSVGKFSTAIDPPFQYETHFCDAIETSDGVLWISTIDKGVFCIKNNEIINQINIAEAQGLMQDHEGNVWISSMGGGVYKISPYFNTHRHYSKVCFDNSGISALCAYPDSGVWMTNGDRVYLLKNHVFYTLHLAMNHRKFNQMYWLKNNSLIVGTKNHYFYALPNATADESLQQIIYDHQPEINFDPGYKAIAISQASNKISAFSPSGLWSINKENLLQKQIITKFDERIHNVFFDLGDKLIVNAKKNYVLRDGELYPSAKFSRFDFKIINEHLRINDSIEAYNVDGDSIYLSCNNRFCNLTQAMNKPIAMMVKKMAYHEPTLYLATSQNIYLIEHPENIHSNQGVDLRIIDINFAEIHDMLVFNDSLYVASDDGLTIIPEAGICKMKSNIPLLYFQSVQVNGSDVDSEKHTLKIRGKNQVKFSFACINYSSAPIIYSYQLAGFDTSWSVGTTRDVVYQNLDIGDYTFRLRAQKPGTEFCTPVDFNIKVSATVWQHPFFYIGLLAIISGWILWSVHRRSLRKRRKLEMDNQLVLLEQKALLTMMNPHFIFNALGSVQNHLLHNKANDAVQYLSQFARLIRQNINAIRSGFISIEDEIDRLKNYLELEKLRMENHFDYAISLEDDFDEDEAMIPSMIIQPFVENAVWHGISQLRNHSGRISISFSHVTDKTIKITITDNGVGKCQTNPVSTNSNQHLNLSTEVTRRRLELLGKKHKVSTSVTYHEVYPGQIHPGTRVVIVAPVSYNAGY